MWAAAVFRAPRSPTSNAAQEAAKMAEETVAQIIKIALIGTASLGFCFALILLLAMMWKGFKNL